MRLSFHFRKTTIDAAIAAIIMAVIQSVLGGDVVDGGEGISGGECSGSGIPYRRGVYW